MGDGDRVVRIPTNNQGFVLEVDDKTKRSPDRPSEREVGSGVNGVRDPGPRKMIAPPERDA